MALPLVGAWRPVVEVALMLSSLSNPSPVAGRIAHGHAYYDGFNKVLGAYPG